MGKARKVIVQVRDEDQTDVLLRAHSRQFCPQTCSQGLVKGAEGFVQEEHLGSRGKGSCDGYPLSLSAGKFIGLFKSKVTSLQSVKKLPYPHMYTSSLPVRAPCPWGSGSPQYVREGAAVFEKAVVLRHQGTVPFPWAALFPPLFYAGITPAIIPGEDIALFWHEKAGEDA